MKTIYVVIMIALLTGGLIGCDQIKKEIIPTMFIGEVISKDKVISGGIFGDVAWYTLVRTDGKGMVLYSKEVYYFFDKGDRIQFEATYNKIHNIWYPDNWRKL